MNQKKKILLIIVPSIVIGVYFADELMKGTDIPNWARYTGIAVTVLFAWYETVKLLRRIDVQEKKHNNNNDNNSPERDFDDFNKSQLYQKAMKSLWPIIIMLFISKGCSYYLEKKHPTIPGASIFNQAVNEPDRERRIELYTEAIENNTDFYEAYINRGAEYCTKGANQNAIEDATKAISLKPNESKPYLLRAIAHTQLLEHDEAISDITKAIEIDSSDSKLYFFRGLVYFDMENYESSAQDFERTTQLQPDEANIYAYLALAYYRNDNISDTRKAMVSAIEKGFIETGTFTVEDFNELSDDELEKFFVKVKVDLEDEQLQLGF